MSIDSGDSPPVPLVNLRSIQPFSDGEIGYAIDAPWIDAYITYCRESQHLEQRGMPSIQNEHLLVNGELAPQLILGASYRLLHKKDWDSFVEAYGGGPEIPCTPKSGVFRVKSTRGIWTTNIDLQCTVFDILHAVCDYFFYVVEYSQLFIEDNPESPLSHTTFLSELTCNSLTHRVTEPIWVPMEYTTLIKGGDVGLKNLGNTCFLNSAMQCLIHSLHFTTYFLYKDWMRDIMRGGKMTQSFAKIVQDAFDPVNSKIVPKEFHKTLIKTLPCYSGRGQQDSHEFLIFLLDSIHEELNHRDFHTREVKYFVGDGMNDPEIAAASWHQFKSNNSSIVVDTFYGLLRSIIRCPVCSKSFITFDPFLSASLPVPEVPPQSNTITFIPLSYLEQTIEFTVPYPTAFSKVHIGQTLDELLERAVTLKYAFCDTQKQSIEWIDRLPRDDKPKPIYAFEVHDLQKNYICVFLEIKTKGVLFSSITPVFRPFLFPIENDVAQDDLEVVIQNTLQFFYTGSHRPFNKKVFDLKNSFRPETGKNPPSYSVRYAGVHFLPNGCVANEPGSTIEIILQNFLLKENFRWDLLVPDTQVIHPTVITEDDLTLEACLKKFTQAITLDENNLWLCPSCNQKVPATKQTDIWALPSVFIIQLKRFTYYRNRMGKITANVSFPDEINMADYICGPQKLEPLRYRLISTCVHKGTLIGGHYTAYARNDITGEWHYFDDSTVVPCESSDVHNSNTYILFFSRIEDDIVHH